MKRILRLIVVYFGVMQLLLLMATPLLANDNSHARPLKIIHFVLNGVTVSRAKEMVSLSRDAGFNVIQVQLTNGVAFDHSPWSNLPNAWTKQEFIGWVSFARSLGFEVIPEIQLLTHQEKFFQGNHPGLLFNAVTYDPRNEDVYKLVMPFLNEIIDAIHPSAIHIGHDEVVGWNKAHARKMLKLGESFLPAHLFLQDVLRLHGYLKSRNVTTWRWGDMLLSPDEFPTMLSRHLHGSLPGYGKELRDKLPRDIVICDWHYFDEQTDFPSLSKMQREGFKVIGATWKQESTIRNFSRYAKEHGAYGMMATTWFHVVKKERAIVDWIIHSSGALFMNPAASVSAQPLSSK